MSFLFERKEKTDPLKEETVREFKKLKDKEEQAKIADSKKQRREDLVEKQKKIFAEICDYCGIQLDYDDNPDRDLFETLDGIFKSICAAVAIAHMNDKLEDTFKSLSK